MKTNDEGEPMGTHQAFTEYVDARWPRLVRSAILLGCAPADAEDIVQTALMRCLKKWDSVENADDRDAYVHRVIINTYTSSRRRFWHREHATDRMPEGATADPTGDIDLADAVLRSLDRLGRDQRTVVVLRYYAHLSEQQMAAPLAVPAGTIKSRLSRAMKTLADDPNLAELRETP